MSDSYRDERVSRELRLNELTEQLRRQRIQVEQLKRLERQNEELEAEIETLRAQIDESSPSRLLDDIVIASPCPESWEEMKGTDSTRFCGVCRTPVYNLSAMTRAEGEALLERLQGAGCFRLYRRDDGSVMTSDCIDGVNKKRRCLRVLSALGGGAIAAAGVVGLDTFSPTLINGSWGRGGVHEASATMGVVDISALVRREHEKKELDAARSLVSLYKERERTTDARELERVEADIHKIKEIIAQLDKEKPSGVCKPGEPMCALLEES